MGFGNVVDRQTVADMEKVRAVIEEFGSEETRESLARDFGPTPPLPRIGSVDYDRYTNRALRGLAEICEQMAAKPRRGRPPKSTTPEPTSQDASMDRTAETEEVGADG